MYSITGSISLYKLFGKYLSLAFRFTPTAGVLVGGGGGGGGLKCKQCLYKYTDSFELTMNAGKGS